VVGVVISVGLSILDLSIKQVRLSNNAKESELAFHAANAGMECARFWRREDASDIETGQPISPSCFGANLNESDVTITDVPTVDVVGDGEVFQYEYEFTWGTGTEARCTSVNMVVAAANTIGVGVTTTNMTSLIPGYPVKDDKYCEAGSQCSTISVQGYNLSCENTGGYGVVQREVLIEF
jgi:hypothetical protein